MVLKYLGNSSATHHWQFWWKPHSFTATTFYSLWESHRPPWLQDDGNTLYLLGGEVQKVWGTRSIYACILDTIYHTVTSVKSKVISWKRYIFSQILKNLRDLDWHKVYFFETTFFKQSFLKYTIYIRKQRKILLKSSTMASPS